MPIAPDFTRPLRADEHDEIDNLLVAAFGRADEADLVRRLRADGDMWHEFVKPRGGVLAGYAALSRMRGPLGWACLAPVAVLAEFQRGAGARDPSQRHADAIGTRLVNEIVSATHRARDLAVAGHSFPETVVVLGKPSFYERAGFSLERARNLVSPYDIGHTLIARPGVDAPSDKLLYPLAFGA